LDLFVGVGVGVFGLFHLLLVLVVNYLSGLTENSISSLDVDAFLGLPNLLNLSVRSSQAHLLMHSGLDGNAFSSLTPRGFAPLTGINTMFV
jgi:hypothetical protein